MRNPNGYGQLIKLSGKRRKPYAIRISAGHEEYIVMPNIADVVLLSDKIHAEYRKKSNDYIVKATDPIKELLAQKGIPHKPHYVRKYKYLAYFQKAKDAQIYLAKMNAGETINPYVPISKEPTFKDVYTMYIQFICSLNKKPTETRLTSYKQGFNLWEDLHHIRFRSITTQQLQDCLSAHSYMSKASVGRMITVIRNMYKYALAHNLCDEDRSVYLFIEYTESEKQIHAPFTKEEIKELWKRSDDEIARIALILIYTGMRCSEFLSIKNEDIRINEKYMIGGLKTEAGKNRGIPLHDKIIPFIQDMMSDKEYLYTNGAGNPYRITHFSDQKWKPYMESIGMDHKTHDCRHTCATLMEEAGISEHHRKLILGHRIDDLTNRIYTHVDISALIKDINLLTV